ncbi:MAG: hypothetical protein K8I27_09560 [Planctomycetes bacterium]|nr:hypothetical protein [Planctomycetota bacterium]
MNATKTLLPLLTVLLGACAQGPVPRYEGPSGQGRLVYEPGVGITRAGNQPSTDEQSTYALIQTAFDERRYDAVINQSTLFILQFPEGSRAVEVLLMRIHARLEAGRPAADAGLPRTIPISQWMFLYLAPAHDTRLQALLNRDETWRTYINELRALTVDEFFERVRPDANALYDSDQLSLARYDCGTLVTYYLPALELREFRRQAAELTRDVAWLLYMAGATDEVIGMTEDLGAMNPEPAIKADALFIQAHAQRLNGAHTLSANTFGFLFAGAGLRDTDTRWRPYALMWQIREVVESSKGPGYDLVPYEIAMELLGEYELYAIENPNIPSRIHEQIVLLLEEVYDIMIARDLNAADTYSRLGESDASDYYVARAEERRTDRDKRVAELRRTP